MNKRNGFTSLILISLLIIIPFVSHSNSTSKRAYIKRIAKNTVKETKEDQTKYMAWQLSCRSLADKRLDTIIYPLEIDKFIIPFDSNITVKQIAYLMLNAKFVKLGEIQSVPGGGNSFFIILKNYIILKCNVSFGSRWIQMTCDETMFRKWLKIPDPKKFEKLGKK